MKLLKVISASLIFLGYLIAPGRQVQADSPPLALDEYWEKVEETQHIVDNLENETDDAVQKQLAIIADDWETITEVRLPNGTAATVDHTAFVAALRAFPADLTYLSNSLSALLAAQERWPRPEFSGADLDLLDTVLARSEFQWMPDELSQLEIWWRKLVAYFWASISWLLPEQAFLAGEGLWFRIGLTVAVSLLLILILLFIMRELFANLIPETALNPDPTTSDEHLTADSAFRRAQRLSGGGDYRTAVRYLYLSSLLLLDERGLLRYDRSRTNREYLRSVAHTSNLAPILHEVIDVFDRVWYGYQPLDEKTYAHYAARVAELRRQK